MDRPPWTGLSIELGKAMNVKPVYLGLDEQDDDYFEDRYVTLATKWQDRIPVAVITDGSTAFAFMRKYREDIFVGAPVFYCGIPRPEPDFLSQCGNCAGIPIKFAVADTIDLILPFNRKQLW